jgi:hypothetical protein
MFRRLLFAAGTAVGLMSAAATALAVSQISVNRCGYTHLRYEGRVALYPFHLSCPTAKSVLAESEAPHVKTIMFSADGAYTSDSDAVLISGKWWVCGGRMGTYFCGYPYRSTRVGGLGGGTTFKGPFTREVAFNACSDGLPGICSRNSTLFLPPG